MHLIIEPYDQGLTQVANINRISTNLELAAEELLYLKTCCAIRSARANQPV